MQEEGYLAVIEIRLKNEIPQEELDGFVSSNDEVAHASKEKKKKPRHRNKKTKKVSKSDDKEED